jgi:hypothetical protein
MNRYILNTLGICIIFALGLAVWGGFVLERHLLLVVDSYGGGQTLAKVNQTLDTINRPCGGGHPCGVLANLDKTQAKIGDLVVTSQLQERDVAKAAEHNMKAVDGLASHLNATADALTGTAQGATETLQQAKVDLSTLDATIATGKPLLDAATITVAKAGDTADSLNDLLKDKAINQTIDNTAVISGNFAATTTDFQTKFHTLLYPPPCHTFGCRLGKTFEIIKEASSLAEPAYWGVETVKAVTK